MGYHWIVLFLLFFFVPLMAFVLRQAMSMLMPGFRQFRMESAVRKTGIGVNADIIYRSKTGMIDGENPVYRLTFKFVTREGIEVQSSLERALDMDSFIRYAPGNVVALKYDPTHPERIALYRHDRPLILGD
ncbi:DUF3592 domain-containing protein [Kosakonia oryzendophytica]|uniref:DUF3592 domain-containing protein n=1 Tax=Kosakonia oryzendophytica TaxID=1005665 RepID=UPI000AB2413F|nr:DUF3592 domain-containing protein [Kosakonia oryzendophytica]WBT59268.1 DUF3592 domain-containing protein [Kosakonia oryzendophytica]